MSRPSHAPPVPRLRRSRRRTLGAAVLCGALLGNLLDEGAILLGDLGEARAGVQHPGGEAERRLVLGSSGRLAQILERLEAMRDSARAMPAEQRAAMPRIDWQAWESLPLRSGGPGWVWHDQLWRVVTELVPATVEAARHYQQVPAP